MADYVVKGVDVHVSGQGSEAIVMVHGWPDTYRLWDAQVEALQDDYTCVRFTLPGFECDRPRDPRSLDELVALMDQIIDTVSAQQPVILMLHDWGCLFGYQFAMAHPVKVSRIIGMDVGDVSSPEYLNSLTPKAKLMIFGYQSWLAAAWKIGGKIGDSMTRAMAQFFDAPGDVETIGSSMNYPYFIQWTGAYGSYRHAMPSAPTVPMLYIYGDRKPFMFQSAEWVSAIAQKEDSRAVAMNTGHWIMREQPDLLNEAIASWLKPHD